MAKTYTGTSGNDDLTGGAEVNYFELQQGGDDTVRGGNIMNYYRFGSTFAAGDQVIGGTGYDVVELGGNYDRGLTITGAMMRGVEVVRLTRGADITLAADLLAIGESLLIRNPLSGGSTTSGITVDGSALIGNIGFKGSEGSDYLTGGSGNDTFDVFYNDPSGYSDVLVGNAGIDLLFLTNSSVGVNVNLVLNGVQQDIGDLSLTISGIEQVYATFADDRITGNAVDNYLVGYGGNDTLIGNGGDDTLSIGPSELSNFATTGRAGGGAGNDTIIFDPGNIFDDRIVRLSLSERGPQDTGLGVYTVSLVENVSGSWMDDRITGSRQANILYGDYGDDVLRGLAGDDTLYGNAYTALGPDYRTFAFFAIGGSDNVEILNGGTGEDRLFGGPGDDILIGGLGSDELTGDLGADTFRYDTLRDSTRGKTDTILDFAAGDRIDLSAIDADAATPGDQAFHIGRTPGRVGDVLVAYDAATNLTTVSLYVDGDTRADATIDLVGNVALTDADFIL